MPFRRLPSTDNQRLQAIEAAAAKAASVDPGNLAFSSESKISLDALLPQFRSELQERGNALGDQVAATGALTAQQNKLRMFASHFLQTLNLAIERQVLLPSDRPFYQLTASNATLPKMVREADLLMWTQRIIDGEAARVAAGGTPIPFPTADEVAAERAAYISLQADQSAKKDALDSEQEDVEAMRDSIDELILDIWDEVEFAFRREAPSSLRANAREYGVFYATRQGEQPDPGQPPAAPSAPTLSAMPGGTVDIAWQAVTEATSYRVEKQVVGVDPEFVELSSGTDLNAQISDLPLGSTLRIRIIAINDNGASEPSDVSEIVVGGTT